MKTTCAKTKTAINDTAEKAAAAKPDGNADDVTSVNNTGNILDDILFVLQTTVNTARENPTVNNVNAVVKALNALKLAQGSRLDKKAKKSRSMISRQTISFIENEILGLNQAAENEKE